MRSEKFHWLANAMELWTDELCAAYGFRRDCWEDTADGKRIIRLLGPDSPPEFTITFSKWRLADAYFQDLVRDLVLQVDRAGCLYTGRYAPGVVPDEFRAPLQGEGLLEAWHRTRTRH